MSPRPDPTSFSERPTELDRERMILEHVPLLKHIVGRMTVPRGFERDDLYGLGMLGLIEAADSFEPERGLKFSTHAYTRIRGAILDELRRSDHLSRGNRERLRVHNALITRSKSYAALFLYRKSINICAQQNRGTGLRAG